MVINGKHLYKQDPIRNMRHSKVYANGVSHGLSEAGYDICIKQEITFKKNWLGKHITVSSGFSAWTPGVFIKENEKLEKGWFTLASSIEEFKMPKFMLGIVHDKSTWARRGLSVFNTVIEPGWKGFLTLELVYHGTKELIIPAGSGIAQVIFHEVSEPTTYTGRYQDQADRPVAAIRAT
jgi:dCTP deaminase